MLRATARGCSDAVPTPSFTDDARQPALVPAGEPTAVPAPQSTPQADWTDACDDAVAGLISLRIPRREAIALVRQSAGATTSEILKQTLQIRGRICVESLKGAVRSFWRT
jgi:hypothetical protein